MTERRGVTIMPGAIVSAEAELVGDVTIGSQCVLSPACKVIAIDGPIILGESNLIEERVEIVNK
jgi:dynactin-6